MSLYHIPITTSSFDGQPTDLKLSMIFHYILFTISLQISYQIQLRIPLLNPLTISIPFSTPPKPLTMHLRVSHFIPPYPFTTSLRTSLSQTPSQFPPDLPPNLPSQTLLPNSSPDLPHRFLHNFRWVISIKICRGQYSR